MGLISIFTSKLAYNIDQFLMYLADNHGVGHFIIGQNSQTTYPYHIRVLKKKLTFRGTF